MKQERRFALLVIVATIGTPICNFNCLAVAAEREEGDAQCADRKTKSVEQVDDIPENTSEEEFSASVRPMILKATAAMADLCMQLGDSESAAKWRTFANRFPADDALHESIEVAIKSLTFAANCCDRSEFRSSRRLYIVALSIFEHCKNQSSADNSAILKFFVVANLKSAQLDIKCEDFKEAGSHIKVARDIIQRNPEFREQLQAFCDLVEASLYDKTRNYQKAEVIYLRLVHDVNPELKLSPRRVTRVQLTLARLYAAMGDSKKSNAALPKDLTSLNDETGEMEPDVALDVMIGCALSESADGKLDNAVAAAQDAVDASKIAFGVASLEYVEALELLAHMRANQGNVASSVELLRKSADLRAQIFGNDHPSVARTHKEVDDMRNRQLDKKSPIWEPISDGEATLADRYGDVTFPADSK